MGLASDLRDGVASTLNAELDDNVEVFESHPAPLYLARSMWVCVADLECRIEPDSFVGRNATNPTRRWSVDWMIGVAVGSGRQYTSPVTAETAVWDLCEDVCLAIGKHPRVGLDARVVGVYPASIEKVVDWDDDSDYRQIVNMVMLAANTRSLHE